MRDLPPWWRPWARVAWWKSLAQRHATDAQYLRLALLHATSVTPNLLTDRSVVEALLGHDQEHVL